jgi:glycine cleavage system regulatory protein
MTTKRNQQPERATMTDVTRNGGKAGVDLPASRMAAVEQGLAYYQEVAHERDALQKLVEQLRTDIASHKVVSEVQQTQLAQMESQVATARLERDRAVADRAKFETLMITIQASLRAFAIPNEPLIRGVEDTQE